MSVLDEIAEWLQGPESLEAMLVRVMAEITVPARDLLTEVVGQVVAEAELDAATSVRVGQALQRVLDNVWPLIEGRR